MASIFDRIGDTLEDVKDAFVEQAPTILPIALNILAPGMGTITATALGAGIGSLLRGDDLDDAVRNAAIGGATGAAFRGLGGGMEGIKQDLSQGGQFFRDPFSAKQYAPMVGGDFDPSFQELSKEVTESAVTPSDAVAELKEPSILNPFQGSPDASAIINSQEYADLSTELGSKKAFEVLSEKYTPSILQRSALPLAGITALLMNPEEEEIEEYGDFLTGEELLAENPERYMIDVSRPERDDEDFVVPYEDYYDRPMFAAKGGVAKMQNGGLAGIQNSLKIARDRIMSSGQAIESALTGTSMNNFMGRATQNPPVVDTFGTTENPRTTLVASPFFKAGHSTDQQYDDFMANQNRSTFPFGVGNLMSNVLPMEDGGAAVPNKYKGFSKLPEAVQQKISPKLAERFAKGGVSFPRRTGGIGPGEGSGTKDDVPAMLMDGEFVMTRDAVRGLGNGNLNKGISRMYSMMDKFERMA